MFRQIAVLFVIAVMATSTATFATIPTVIFSNIASSPSSDVPGIPGLKFKAGTTSSTAFDRPFVSPDGTRWVFGGFVEAPTSDDDVIVVGQGVTGAGASVRVRAGTPTSFDANVNYNAINTHLGINNAGQVSFSGTTTATSSQYIGFHDGTSVQRIAQQGGPTPIAGSTWTATLNGANLTGSGLIGYQGTTTPTPTQQLTVLAGSIVSQNNVTIPTGQLAPAQTNNTLTSNSFRVSDDGLHTMYRTTLNGPTATNTVVVLDNQVLAQLGVPVPGWSNMANISSIASEAGSVHLSRNGQHWAFRGAVNDGSGAANQTDFVLVNGNVVAATDMPIFAGATELYDDAPFAQTFFVNTTNNLGDYVIGGTTNSADAARNAVLVFNHSRVIAREFDPVDLDGNGLLDDDAFIDIFGNDDGALTDDLNFYFVASLRNSAGSAIGNALLVVTIPEPSAGLSWALIGVGTLLLKRRKVRSA